MSSADISKAAALYLKSIEAGIPELVRAKPERYASLRLAIRDMSRALAGNRCVVKNSDGTWGRDEAAIEKAAANRRTDSTITQTYRRTARALDRATVSLVDDGKNAFLLDLVRDIGDDPQIEYQTETTTAVRRSDMEAVVGASLTLLEAVDLDPANAHFVPGLGREALSGLDDLLRQQNYLMPGENPERKKPIAQQELRGTMEDQESLFLHVKAMTANMAFPQSINAGDRPATAAFALKRAVESAQTEEITASEYAASLTGYSSSDLSRDGADALYSYIGAAMRLARNATWNVESGAQPTVLVAPQYVEDALTAKSQYEAAGLHGLLASGEFRDPSITADQASRLAHGLGFIGEAITTNPEIVAFTGDDGGLMTQEGETISAESTEFDNEFDQDLAESGLLGDVIATTGREDMAADIYGKSDAAIRIIEPILSEGDQCLLGALVDGTITRIGEIAGRDDVDLWDSRAENAYAGTIEEAMGVYEMLNTTDRHGAPHVNAITTERRIQEDKILARHNPEARPPRRARIRSGTDPFRTYKHGLNPKRMTEWLDRNILTRDGKLNLKLAAWLRDATQMQVEGRYIGECHAAYDYAQRFVVRQDEHRRLKIEADREKRGGITRVELDSTQVRRMVSVLEAGGDPDALVRANLDPSGKVVLTHEDGPRIDGHMDHLPREMEKASGNGKGRRFSGQIPLSQFKAALESGERQVVLLIDGEVPYGVIGKEQDMTREAEKKRASQRNLDDVALS